MRLVIKQSGRYTYLYAIKGYRTESGKSTTKVVKKFGTVEELREKLNGEDPIAWASEQVARMTEQAKAAKEEVVCRFKPNVQVSQHEQCTYNGGYLFLQKVYHELSLERICKKLDTKHKNQYDLNAVLSLLLYTRILYPGSKVSSLEDAHRFLEKPSVELHQIYRALSLLAQESDTIQAEVYKYSKKLIERNTRVLYYDCTNYYFESEEEEGLRQYGHSKESRPNPLVQMGLFMDMDGFPPAFCINPGNTAETQTLKPLEEKLRDKFELSKVVVCTDGGISSYANRQNAHIAGRAFITVQSLKKLKRHIQKWALDTEGWQRVHVQEDKQYNLNEINPIEYYDTLFYKERWINENGLEQRIIVTFSFKYRAYLNHIRQRQIDRAQKIIDRGAAGKLKKSTNDPKRFIKQEYCTEEGELAQISSYSINKEMIEQEERFDGFYAIATDLNDKADKIIKANGRRWIIENGFRIMKTEFEASPVYLRRDDRIKAHFFTCFLALLVYKHIEKKVNRGGMKFSTEQIIQTLVEMNFVNIEGEGFIPTYTCNELTNNLHGSAGFRTDTQIVTKKTMRSIIAMTKKMYEKE